MSTEPDYEAAIALIRYLPVEELKDLMNNEDKISDIVRNLPQIQNLVTEKTSLLKSNKSTAESNLTFENKLSDGKQDLSDKYEKYSNLLEEIANMEQHIQDSSADSKYSSRGIQALLKTSARDLEEKSEAVVDKLLNKEEEIDDFLTTFVPMKTQAHKQRIGCEKITEMIKSGKIDTKSSMKKSSKGRSSYPNHSSSYPVAPGENWSTPYPTQPMRMPMPGV